MLIFNKISIRNRLLFIILFVTSITFLMSFGAFTYWYIKSEQIRSLELSKMISKAISQNVAKMLLLDDVSQATDLTSQLSSFPFIVSVTLYDKKRRKRYRYENKHIDKKIKEYYTFLVKAKYLDYNLGFIEFKIIKENEWSILKKYYNIFIITYLFGLILSIILAYIFSKQFTDPILKLVKFLEKVEYKILKERIEIDDVSEYGLLYKEINEMLDKIEKFTDELMLSSVTFETQSGIVVTDTNGKVLRVNEAFLNETGFETKEILEQNILMLKSQKYKKKFYANIVKSLIKYHYWGGEIYIKHKDNKDYPKYLTIQSVVDDNKIVKYYVFSFIDLTIENKIKERLNYLRNFDALTGFVNRNMILNSLQKYLTDEKQTEWGAIVCFGLKNFKEINDIYGYDSGDLLLQKISKRILKNCKEYKMISRMGNDEFVLWFDKAGRKLDDAQLKCQIYANKLIELFKKPFLIDNKIIHIDLFIGIELYSKDEKDAIKILKQADTALSIAKTKDTKIAFFDKNIERSISSRLDIYSELKDAIKNREFELYYQLQYNKNKEPIGAEALIRWNHPKKGVISPSYFIPIAEKTDLIIEIGKWVFEETCKQLVDWGNNKKTSHLFLSVNVSAKQFREENFISYVKDIINTTGVDSSKIKVELTETIMVDNIKNAIDKMIKLKEMNIRLSLDDFGTGYSSLQYLKYFPLNQIKIDQLFVKNMLGDRSDMAIVETIVALGKTFGFNIIAEGVETKEHYEQLKKIGCEYFQGFYFAKPMKIEDINDIIL